ncbi:MAG TPA: DUF4173 domain-containing protein [Anaerolineales bacterium]|nr:DUF4173 domain-containing protein [Anaerolineales bacterium]
MKDTGEGSKVRETSDISDKVSFSGRTAVLLTLTGLGLGVAVEVLFYGHPPGISFFLWTALCVTAVLALSRVIPARISPSVWPSVVAGLFFSLVVFFRQEPLTVFLAVMLTFFFLAMTVRVFRFGNLERFGWIDLVVTFFWVPIEAWIRPWPVAGMAWGRTVREQGGSRVFFSVLRGLLLALPIVVVFLALLSAADLIFGDYVARALAWLNLEQLLDWSLRALVIVVSGLFLLGALTAALRDPGRRRLIGEDPPIVRPFLGFTETTLVLALVAVVFLLFVIVQFAYLFGGAANIHAAGYTYAEYARRGFGELVTVAVLALSMVYALAAVTHLTTRGRRTIFFFLCTGIVVFVGVMLVSAFQRLVLYEQAYGFSRLRTYTHVAIGWLAVAFVVFLVLLGLRRLRAMALAALAIATGFTATLALLNVDAFIVDWNAARYQQNGDLDVDYLVSLTDDAVPGLVALVRSVHGEQEEDLLAALSCRRRALVGREARLRWPSAQASRSAALAALATIDTELAEYVVFRKPPGPTDPPWAEYRVKTPDGVENCPAWGVW